MTEIYTLSMLISIGIFTLTTHITPGPTNIILLSSVLNFGYKRSLPFIFANIISYPLMMLFTGLGIGLFLISNPAIMQILKIFGFSYLCWMAWKIAKDTSNYNTNDVVQTKPFNFWQSFIYPFLNPKAWIVYTSSISIFITSSEKSFLQIGVITLFILFSMFITVIMWAFCAIALKKFIKNEKIIKRVNLAMSILLVISVLPIMV